MKQILSLIRRHPWLFAGTAAGTAVILLAGIGIFGVRSTGSGSGSGQARASNASAKSPTTVARTAAPKRPTHVILAARTVTVAGTRHGTRNGGVPASTSLRATPPSNAGVALALRQTTGLSPSQVAVHQLCPAAGTGHARCAGEALVLRSDGAVVHPRVTPATSGGAPSPGTPAYLQEAYDLSYLSQNEGSGDTVAIVDAYDDPTAASDLSAYRSFYGLPACTTASGCFKEINQNGGSTLPTTSNSGWGQETSLDLDAVSAVCPNCHIVLVEATSATSTNMIAADQAASAVAGVKQISNSWTMTSSSDMSGPFTFSGIATVAATGDEGYLGAGVDNYPAAAPGVTAAGGTSLPPASTLNVRGFSEGAWSGAGSGCDLNVTKPSYQSDSGCTGRSYADLSADADPNTGLATYDNGQWLQIGGTSLATPLIAAYYAITGVADSTPQWAYNDSGALNDITSGSNGNCAANISYICNARVGYDGPTGLGSISGATFSAAPGIGGPPVYTGQNTANTYTQTVGATNASIAAGIYRNGLDTKWWIQYGTTTSYGSQTAAVDIGAGSTPVSITGSISPLAPSYGAQYFFTTPAAVNPSASFTDSPTAPAPGAPVSFDGSSSVGGNGATITDYSWNFGDGTTQDAGSTATAQHTYASRGTYTVSLTVTNSAGKHSTTSQTVTVDFAPTPAFTQSTPVASPTVVNFDGSGSSASTGGSITDYSWNFGDGQMQDTGTTPTAQHTYTNPGAYTVTLTTTDDLNVSNTVSETIIAGPFTASPTVPAPGTAVTLTVPSLSGITGTITDYSWDFGDGTTQDTGTTPSATHTYSDRQDETVTLTITTSGSQTFSGTETIPVDDPPTAAVDDASTIVGAPGQAVDFNGSSSDAESPGSIKTYTWDFGDGTTPVTANSPTTSHVYASVGIYQATLTVTDDLGATDSTTQQVVVDQPAPAFTAPATTPVALTSPASFNAGASSDPEGTITDYSWNFGDGMTQDTGTTPSATHAYSQRGQYTVTLTITNSYGQSASTTRSATADNPPTAAFTPSTTLATAGGAISFNGGASTAMSGGSISDYYWNFGDGTALDTGGANATSHSYGSAGTYTVTLTTTDDLGLTSTASRLVTIDAAPVSTTPPASTSPPTSPPAHAPVTPAPLTANLSGPTKLKLASALAHGMRVSLAMSQGAKASFQITLPVLESKLAGRRLKTASIVLLHTKAQSLGAGTHPITLKLSRAAARELAGRGPLVLTVKVTVTGANGKTFTRSLKIKLR